MKSYPGTALYDEGILRTLFLEFENADWEKELESFHGTDVDVPAQLTVDGKTYEGVGVRFRGMSSYMMVPETRKRSLNLALDLVDENQRLLDYRTLNLLNAHEDPSFLRACLYLHIAREYAPAPKANFVRVVINGESWGVYASAQQFNKDFIRDWFGSAKGARWKAPGSPNGRASLAYLGEDTEPYRKLYDIKTKDDPKSWAALIRLCKTLNETSPDQLEAALAPMFDVEGALKFLALENALINNDGYWARSSDYNLYLDEKGRFHIIPHDANETFARAGGPGGPGGWGRRGPGGPGGSGGAGGAADGVKLDPLVAASDASKPLISKLLAVPALRTRYLGYVRDIADKWLDWNRLGPIAQQWHDLIAADVEKDTHKLNTTEQFRQGLTSSVQGGRGTIGLKEFADQRRAFLLNHEALKPSAADAKPLPELRPSQVGYARNSAFTPVLPDGASLSPSSSAFEVPATHPVTVAVTRTEGKNLPRALRLF